MNRFIVIQPRDRTIKLITGRFFCQRFLHIFDSRLEFRNVKIVDGFCGFRRGS